MALLITTSLLLPLAISLTSEPVTEPPAASVRVSPLVRLAMCPFVFTAPVMLRALALFSVKSPLLVNAPRSVMPLLAAPRVTVPPVTPVKMPVLMNPVCFTSPEIGLPVVPKVMVPVGSVVIVPKVAVLALSIWMAVAAVNAPPKLTTPPPAFTTISLSLLLMVPPVLVTPTPFSVMLPPLLSRLLLPTANTPAELRVSGASTVPMLPFTVK